VRRGNDDDDDDDVVFVVCKVKFNRKATVALFIY
jgi:hypothetical protein